MEGDDDNDDEVYKVSYMMMVESPTSGMKIMLIMIHSQAARKFDIPYPTFVLYANRVHNMLGPTPLGVSEMRPKVILKLWVFFMRGINDAKVSQFSHYKADGNSLALTSGARKTSAHPIGPVA